MLEGMPNEAVNAFAMRLEATVGGKVAGGGTTGTAVVARAAIDPDEDPEGARVPCVFDIGMASVAEEHQQQ